MLSEMSLKERAIMAKKLLEKQAPVTFEEAKAQVERIKSRKIKKESKNY